MEIFLRLNWVDLLVVILMLRISYVAFQDGLSHEIFPLIGAICTLVLALGYYKSIALFLSQNIMMVNALVAAFFSFLALVIVTGLIFKLLKRVVDVIVKVSWHPAIEKFGGLVMGIMRASVVTSTVLIIVALTPLPYIQWSIRDKSVTGMSFLRIGPEIYVRVARFLPGGIAGKVPAGEALVAGIVSDKSIFPKKTVDDRDEWEKELQKDLTSKPSNR